VTVAPVTGPVTFPDLCLRQYVVTPAEPVGA